MKSLTITIGLLALVGACGDVKHDLPDGSSNSDSKTVDSAPPADSAPLLVTVHVLDPRGTGAAAQGVPVVFIDADGVQKVATDANGAAAAKVKAGASATSVAAISTGFVMFTATELQPGDSITLGAVQASSDALAAFNVTVPNATGGGSPFSYQVFGPCGGSDIVAASVVAAQTVVPVPLRSGCNTTPATLEIHALDAKSTSKGFLVVKDVAITAGGSTTITGSYAADLTMASTYSNIDAVTNVTTTRLAPDGHGFTASQATPHTTGAAVTTVTGPKLDSDTVVAQSFLQSPAGNQTIRELTSGTATTYAFDGPTRLLPWVGKPTVDLAAGKITVPVDPTGTTGTAPDLFRVQVSYNRSSNTGGTTTNTLFAWTVFGPTPGDVTLPAIPSDAGDIMPKSTDRVGVVIAESFELDTIDGYAHARLNPADAASQIDLAVNPGATLVRFAVGQTRGGGVR